MALEVREQLFPHLAANKVHILANFPAARKLLSANHGCHALHHDQTIKASPAAAHFSKNPCKTPHPRRKKISD
jgi:hypothetical protein